MFEFTRNNNSRKDHLGLWFVVYIFYSRDPYKNSRMIKRRYGRIVRHVFCTVFFSRFLFLCTEQKQKTHRQKEHFYYAHYTEADLWSAINTQIKWISRSSRLVCVCVCNAFANIIRPTIDERREKHN